MFVQDADSPEAIWQNAMRLRLAAAMRTHVAGFAARVREDVRRPTPHKR